MAYLADVNFLVALLHARHAHSERAIGWLEGQPVPVTILLCRVVQMGVLRVLTNRAWMKEDAQSAAAVWRAWDLLLSDDRFVAIEEPQGFEAEWRRLTESLPPGRCAETDAYLAAFARAGGHRILTFDRDFRRFSDVEATFVESE
jgi:toxin-antitoxin system PIN domain toxin